MLEALRLLALVCGKEQAVRKTAVEIMWDVANETRELSSEDEAIDLWKRKQAEWVAMCKRDPEIKTCVLRRAVNALNSELCDFLDSHGVWNE